MVMVVVRGLLVLVLLLRMVANDGTAADGAALRVLALERRRRLLDLLRLGDGFEAVLRWMTGTTATAVVAVFVRSFGTCFVGIGGIGDVFKPCFTLGAARCGQFQHLRDVGVDQEERVLIDSTLSHQDEIDFGDGIEAALGVLAFAAAETGTRVILEKIFVVLLL